ncbi:MAG: BON domain-containing protein [Planctomycetota bacterium]|nr:BON domain-containing protein [Planctomycetota bacterium]
MKFVSAAVACGRSSLAEKVIQSLAATGYMPLRNVTVVNVEGLVILRGRVPTYYLKQMCQSVAMSVNGVHEVRNEVEVV